MRGGVQHGPMKLASIPKWEGFLTAGSTPYKSQAGRERQAASAEARGGGGLYFFCASSASARGTNSAGGQGVGTFMGLHLFTALSAMGWANAHGRRA